MKIDLIIDLFDGNTIIYKNKEGIVLKEPNLICISKVDDQYYLNSVGSDINYEKINSSNSHIFNPILGGDVKNLEYSTIMLKTFLGKVKNKRLTLKPNALFITNCGNSKQFLTNLKKLAKKSGIKKYKCIPRVVFFEKYINEKIKLKKNLLIVYFGEETTDFACVKDNFVIKGGHLNVGTNLMDTDIQNYIKKKHKININIDKVKDIRKKLITFIDGDERKAKIEIFDKNNRENKNIEISSMEIYFVIQNYLNTILPAIQTTINMCEPEMVNEIVENGIYVFGEITNLKGFSNHLNKILKMKINVFEDSEIIPILAAEKIIENKNLKTIIDIYN